MFEASNPRHLRVQNRTLETMSQPSREAYLMTRELELARTLLEGRSAEDLAAALVRMYRARLPAPEEITDLAPLPGTRRESVREAGVRPEKASIASGPMVWFSINVGRGQKADPKWLLPLICRMGGVEKRDVGAIRIQPDETRFEISVARAEEFAANIPDDAEDNVKVTRAEAPSAAPRREPGAPKRFVKSGYAKKDKGNNAKRRAP